MSDPYRYRAVANGLHTDHPLPDLPFVNDSHIPVDDPRAVEAIGRGREDGMWGREDDVQEGGWVVYTTDPLRHDLAWCVRSHPDHGRSVVLYRDDDAPGVYMTYWGQPLLFRAGGYWWDGSTWYRPLQIWDRASEKYVRRPVPAASTITAADLLASHRISQNSAHVWEIDKLKADETAVRDHWLDHLALWASHRDPAALSQCVVTLTAPELNGGQLVGAAEMAEIGGVAASTFRSYLSRGENSIPLPQATTVGRAMWTRPVAEEWAEKRRHSDEGAAEILAENLDVSSLPVGVSDLWQRFTKSFLALLWDNPARRRRWALRWRSEAAVQEVAETLAWQTAASLEKIIPVGDLSVTIRKALVNQFAESKELHRITSTDENPLSEHGLLTPVACMLDWLIRHEPRLAAGVIGETAGEVERQLGISRNAAAQSFRTALSLDGKLEYKVYDEFLDRALPPDCN